MSAVLRPCGRKAERPRRFLLLSTKTHQAFKVTRSRGDTRFVFLESERKQKLNSPGDQVFAAWPLAGMSSVVNHTLLPALQGGAGTEHAKLHIQPPAKALWLVDRHRNTAFPVGLKSVIWFSHGTPTNRCSSYSSRWEHMGKNLTNLHFSHSRCIQCTFKVKWNCSDLLPYLGVSAGNHVGGQLDDLAAFWTHVQRLRRNRHSDDNLIYLKHRAGLVIVLDCHGDLQLIRHFL